MSGSMEGDDDDEEEFYDPLDRIISSSCSSTSASDEDADHHLRRRIHGGLPRFPPPSTALSHDAWISGMSSVEERRRRLLQQMGIADVRDLDRRLSAPPPIDCCAGRLVPGEEEIGRSVSCHGIYGWPERRSIPPIPDRPPVPAVGRSRSDSAVDSPAAARNGCLNAGDGDLHNGDENGSDPRLTIKNLDDGREFVVREDGTWGRVNELGTGRQLTMEEFDMCVGRSPIVQELMRRQFVSGSTREAGAAGGSVLQGSRHAGGTKIKMKEGWLRSIKYVSGGSLRERLSSVERDTSSEKGGRRSSSATNESHEGTRCFPEKVKVRQHGKTHKELTALYLTQEIKGHNGSIWSIKFSLDGRFLASAGEDCVIHVWRVLDYGMKEELFLDKGLEVYGNSNPFFAAISNRLPEPTLALTCIEVNHWEKKRRAKVMNSVKLLPENVFSLSENPVCSFKGHNADVLDLSWSKSQYLLSSSMDKTVRLWHVSSNTCLKTFSHIDYVTCIQFNPIDDRYFISGSLDEKIRLWSIPNRQVVDWIDLHEMVTAVCYTPDGKGALVGSHKGSCHLYDTSENKLQLKSVVDLQNKKKKSRNKKITGFQFAPASLSEVLVTSADSQIRVIDDFELVRKFKGFRNTSSQISASFTTNGKYVVCASEDSHVYLWRHDTDSRPGRSKGAAATVTRDYEQFHCQGITVAVTWPSSNSVGNTGSHVCKDNSDEVQKPNLQALMDASDLCVSLMASRRRTTAGKCAPSDGTGALDARPGSFADRVVSATWPEEKLDVISGARRLRSRHEDLYNGGALMQSGSAWGLVIVTAGRGGELRAFQNFGFPVRI